MGAFPTDRADVGGFLPCRIILHPCCVSHPGPPAGLSMPPMVSLPRACSVARNRAVVWHVCTGHHNFSHQLLMLLLKYRREPQLCGRVCHEVSQVEKLRGMVGIRWLARIPAIDAFIAGLLPSLVLRIFLALLPELLAYIGRMQGLISLSQVQFSVVRRYFAFQVISHSLRIYGMFLWVGYQALFLARNAKALADCFCMLKDLYWKGGSHPCEDNSPDHEDNSPDHA